MKSASKICVAVRKRPPGLDDKDVVNCNTATAQLVINEPKIKYDLTPYTDKHNFCFDEIFDERANNREVYSRCAAPLVEHVFTAIGEQKSGGGKSSDSCPTATCFCYGQTGTGKSWTLLGNPNEPGVYLCAAHEVFTRAAKSGGNLSVFVSFYEIYGRKLFDLLNDRAKLVCREDGNSVIQICGLTEHPAERVDQMVGIIEAGNALRAAGQTSANAESSRSHAVLQMEVRDMRDQRAVGKIAFIDLAGNERGSDTFDCDRKTRIEGAEINKSLLALKECIRALGMGKSHVPFRGSILTEVLRDSFLGNSRTTMIATISALAQNCEHTLNTLRYTSRVKELGPAGKKVRANVESDFSAVPAAAAAAPAVAAPVIGKAAQQRAAAMAERVAMDAAAQQMKLNQQNSGNIEPVPSRINGGRPSVSGISNSNPAAAAAAAAAVKPVPKQGRRAVGGAQAPPAAAAAAPATGKRNGAARGGKRDSTGATMLDPIVATIVESHIRDVDEIDTETGIQGEDDESDSEDNSSSSEGQKESVGASYRKVRAVHAHIVSRIRQSEESVLQVHRRHIDHKMAMMKSEVAHLQALDQSSSIDEYVEKVDVLLERQMREIQDMRDRLLQIGKYLKEEEMLSKTLTPAGKRQRPK